MPSSGADLVIFVYRDEYDNEESDQQGLTEIILSKHRNGPTGVEKLSFLSATPSSRIWRRDGSWAVLTPAGCADLAPRDGIHGRVQAAAR